MVLTGLHIWVHSAPSEARVAQQWVVDLSSQRAFFVAWGTFRLWLLFTPSDENFREWMCFSGCWYSGIFFFFLSLSISLSLITFLNDAVSDHHCHSFPSFVNYVRTHDTCFDVGFFSLSMAYYGFPNNLTFTAVSALTFQRIWWNNQVYWFSNISVYLNYLECLWNTDCWALQEFLPQEVWGVAWECAFPPKQGPQTLLSWVRTFIGPWGSFHLTFFPCLVFAHVVTKEKKN